LRGQLKDGGFLTWMKTGKQHDFSVRKFQGIVMRLRYLTVDLTKYSSPSVHSSATE